MSKKAESILQALAALKSQRSVLDSLWEDCAFFCMPAYQYIKERVQEETGDRRVPSDSHGIYCTNTLSSHLFSNTVSMGQKWFGLRAEDEAQNKQDEIARWHSAAADIGIKEISESNFSLQIFESIMQLVTFGTAVVYSEFHTSDGPLDPDGPVYTTYKITDCWIAEGPDKQVDTLYREFQFTAKQAYQKWGDKCSAETVNKAKHEATANEKVLIVHAVYPRPPGERKRKKITSDNMAWASVFVEQDASHVISEGGYEMFPFAVPRFKKVDGQVYGRSPAMDAMADLRMLNTSKKDFIDALEQETLPPIFLPAGMSVDDVDLRPAAVNSKDSAQPGEKIEHVLPNVNLVPVLDFIRDLKQAVSDMFYLDLFLALEHQNNMTAMEVIERVNEKIHGVAPVVSRLQSELYSPLIRRTIALLGDNGKLPPSPLDMGDEVFATVEYTTRLDAKLADVETNQLLRSVEQAAMIYAKIMELPQLKAMLKADDAVRQVFHNNRVDVDLLNSQKDVEEQRRVDAEAAEAAQAAQTAAEKIQPIDMQKAPEEGSPIESAGVEI